jgi:hypothetical protein
MVSIENNLGTLYIGMPRCTSVDTTLHLGSSMIQEFDGRALEVCVNGP